MKEKGCRYLAQTNWMRLENIYMGNTGFMEKGCENLSKAEWGNFQELFLCNLESIKVVNPI